MNQLVRNQSDRLYNDWQTVRPWDDGKGNVTHQSPCAGAHMQTIKVIVTFVHSIFAFMHGYLLSNRAWLTAGESSHNTLKSWCFEWASHSVPLNALTRSHDKDLCCRSQMCWVEIVDRELLWIRNDIFMKDLALSILRFWVLTLCHLQCTVASVRTSVFCFFVFSFSAVSKCPGTSVGEQDKLTRWRCASRTQLHCHYKSRSISQKVRNSFMISDTSNVSYLRFRGIQ